MAMTFTIFADVAKYQRGGKAVSNVSEIIVAWLKEHKYDGLAGDECGCPMDDMGACESNCLECVPAYKVDCSRCKDGDECPTRNSDSDILYVSECEQTIRQKKARAK